MQRGAAQPSGRASDHPQCMVGHLQLLNDTLAASPMAGRTWLFGGVLLGWAREGALLAHDQGDADLAFLGSDLERLEASADALADAGFALRFRFPGRTGRATEYSYERGGCKFDLFLLDVVGDRFRYHNYACHGGPAVVNVAEIPAQPLEEIRFLDRTWLKVADHDAELTALYGDWRTPEADWDYRRGPAIVETRPWDPSSFDLARAA